MNKEIMILFRFFELIMNYNKMKKKKEFYEDFCKILQNYKFTFCDASCSLDSHFHLSILFFYWLSASELFEELLTGCFEESGRGCSRFETFR